MPKITRKSGARKNRRTSRPNVFARSQPTPRTNGDSEDSDAPASSDAAPVRARAERTTRIAGARSEIFTRSLPAELKKLGTLAGVIVVALVILTFAI